ncbi:MAG: YwbE family protein [Methanoregula sp.]|nr:YwbE family protein [Methanoregula sp.]
MTSQNDAQQRSAIVPGTSVDIVTKAGQRSGKAVRGIVKEILTNSSFHPHGIKVRLQDGQVGRVQAIIPTEGKKGE